MLADLLVQGRFVADVERRRRVRGKKQDARFVGDAGIGLVEDRAAKLESLEKTGVAVGVGAGEDAIALGQAAVEQVRPDEEFFGQLGDFVGAVLEDEQNLVEFRALDLEFLAVDLVSDIAAFAVVGHLERLECDFPGVDFVVPAGFRGQAGVARAVLLQQRLQVCDDVLGQVLQVPARLFKIGFDLVRFFAVLVDIEKGNPADANRKQFFHVGLREVANHLPAERLEFRVHCGDDRLVGFALLDGLVEPLLDEDAFEGAEVQFVLELLLPQLELLLEQFNELPGVFAQYVGHRQFDRMIVLDDHKAAGDGRLAIREGVQGIHEFPGIHTRGALDFDLRFFGGEIIDGFDLELAFAGRVFDGSDQRFRGGPRRNLLDDDRGFIPELDLGADFDAPLAVGIVPRVHLAAGGEIRQAFERLFLEDGDLRLEQLGKIMREDAR